MFRAYRKNTDGNVAMMFSVSIFGILVAVGAAMDFSQASRHKQNLQDIIDAATLAAAKAKTEDRSELEQIAADVVEQHNYVGSDIILDIKVVDGMIEVTGRSTYDTSIMRIVGRDKMGITAVAASPIAADTPIKLALVLDTTDSMSGADMTALKSATNSLLDELENFNAVAVSVVPFGQYVNVGTHRKGSTWLDVSKDGTSETEEVCWDERRTITPRVCEKTGRRIGYDIIRDGRFMGRGEYDEEICTGGETELTGQRICEDRTTNYTWSGCVGSRQSPYNEQASFGTRHIEGVMNKTCGTELLELTKNLPSVRTKIQGLSTAGNTYLPSGVVWGWRSLQDEYPLKTNVNLDNNGTRQRDPVKAMIFMTDGDNTLSQGGDEAHLHERYDANAANARTAALCSAAKADGIQIYTIGYRMGDADASTRNLLMNCASNPSQYRDASNAQELKQTFKDIAGQLDVTRLSM